MGAIKTYFTKFIVLALALQILNLSICGGEDATTLLVENSNTIGEQNQIDCLYEFVSEVILDYKNIVKESGAHNNNGNHSLLIKHLCFKLYPHNCTVKIPQFSPVRFSIYTYKEHYKSLYCKEVIPQPPNSLTLFA